MVVIFEKSPYNIFYKAVFDLLYADRKLVRLNIEIFDNFSLSTHQRRWIRDSSVDVVIRIPSE